MFDSQPLDLIARRVLESARRQKKTILLWIGGTLFLGLLVFVFAPRTYRSEARIFLRVGRESVGLDPTATTGQNMLLQQADRKDEVKSAIEVLKSRSVIAEAVDRLGADMVLGRRDANGAKKISLTGIVTAPLHWLAAIVKSVDPVSDREEAIIRMERHLYVGAERESTVIGIEYDADTPQLAQAVCDAIVDVYQQENMRIHRSDESRPFFTEQQDRLRSQLDDALESVRKVKNELGLSSVQERRTSLETQFNAVELDRLNTEQQLATSQARIVDLEHQLTLVPERLVGSKKSVPNQGADLLRQQLYALEVKAMDLQARYSDSHPLVKAAKDQLTEAKQVLTQQSEARMETTDDINPIHRNLSLEFKREQSAVAGLKARATELGQQKESVLSGLRAINDQDLKLDQLTRQADLARDKYLQYARNMEEARIDIALQNERISNVSVLQPATLAEKPVSPSKPLLAAATLLLAIAGAGALTLGRERFGNRTDNPAEDELAFDAPTSGEVVSSRVRRRVNGQPQSPQVQPQG